MADDTRPADDSADETKRKFREALEKKKQSTQNRPGAFGPGGGIQGEHARAETKRQFRRKSG